MVQTRQRLYTATSVATVCHRSVYMFTCNQNQYIYIYIYIMTPRVRISAAPLGKCSEVEQKPTRDARSEAKVKQRTKSTCA